MPRSAAESELETTIRRPSLPDVFSSVRISTSPQLWRRALGFIGPGFIISVGYMDPGNWATDLAAGSRYGYTLLFAIMVSNLLAILLQGLAVKLGVATEMDLAQACREHYSKPVTIGLWIFAEIAIAACDLAEVIGSAIALQLLFGIPLLVGVLITSLDVLLILLLQNRGFRYFESVVIVLIGTIAAMFAIEIVLVPPGVERHRGPLVCAIARDPCEWRHAVHRHRNSGCDGDAAQSVPAFFDRADARLFAHSRRQTGGDMAVQPGFRRRAYHGAVCEWRHPGGCRRGVSSVRA